MTAGDDALAARFLGASPNMQRTTLRRMTSTSSTAMARRTTTFSDLLSDSSSDSGSSDDDVSALQRMQEQADDMTYMDNHAFGPHSPELAMHGVHTGDDEYDDAYDEDKSFRLSTQPPPARRKTVVDVDTNLNEIDGVILDSDEEYDEEEDGDGSFHSDNDSSFASSAAPEDHSFRSAVDDEEEEEDGDDEYGDEDEEMDHSFSSAMADEVNHDDDEEDMYDAGGYGDDEDAEQKQVDPYEHDQEERVHSIRHLRLSEAPFDEPARVSHASSSSSATQSFASFSSAGEHFFVESVRGSVDSVAPVMDLPFSPSPYSNSVQSTGSSSSIVGSVPNGLSMGSSFDGGKSLPKPDVSYGPVDTIGFRVVNHTQAAASAHRSTVVQRESSLSSSSSDASMNDVSFSSNIDDSFADANRSSSSTDPDPSFMMNSVSNNASPVKIQGSIPVEAHPLAHTQQGVVQAPSAAGRPTESLVERKTKTFARPLPPSRAAARRAPIRPPPAIADILSVPLKMESASPAPASGIDNSIASSRASDVRLDFAGVFTGDGDEKTSSQRNRKIELAPVISRRTEMPFKDADIALAAATAGPPTIKRVVSAQEASEIKVEEFFRKTYQQNHGDDDSDFLLSSSHSVRGRAKTSAGRDDPLMLSTRSTRSKSAAQLVDLKNVRSGQHIDDLLRANEEESKEDELGLTRSARAPSRPSVRFPINEELLEEHFPSRPSTARSVALSSRRPSPPRPNEPPLTPITFSETSSDVNSLDDSQASEYESPRVIQRNFTLSLASGTISRSSFTVSTTSSPNGTIAPSNYTMSPRRPVDRQTSSSSQWSVSQANSSDAGTPTLHPQLIQLPDLSVAAKGFSGGSTGSSLAASRLGNSGIKASSFNPASSSLRSPNPMAASTTKKDVAPGFRWHPELSQQHPGGQTSVDAWSSEDGSLSIKESVWHAAGALSIGSGRPSVAASVASQLQRVSTGLKSSLHRARRRFFPPPPGARDPNEPTSPTSICSAPPKLPRGFDDRRFYSRFGNIECGENMIVVNRPARVNPTKDVKRKRKRKVQMWMLLLGFLFGVVFGIGLVHIDPIASSFKLVVNPETGEITMPVAVKWLMLPGSLFLRGWNCVSMPLLFCQVANGVAELTMTHNIKPALSFRAVGYLLATSLLTTLEGIGLVLVYHAMGLFAGNEATLKSRASSVMAAMGVSGTTRIQGMTAMMCGAEEAYLQVSQNGQRWRCSNETIPLPIQDGIEVNGESWRGTSAAVFAFTDLKSSGKASVISSAYYPTSSSSLAASLSELITAITPNNFIDSFSKSLALSTVVVGICVGLIVGVRAWHRSITAYHQLQQSQSQARTQATQIAESILAKPHPILGVMVEFQLLLEWIAESIQVLAPIGVASIIASHIVVHRDEWFVMPSAVSSLLLGVVLASVIHITLIAPLLLKLVSDVNAWQSLPHFLSSFYLSVGTGDPVTATPVLANSFESAQVVTKSMSQVGVGIAAAIHRSGHGLYYPLAMLFLLQTNFRDQDVITLDAKAVLLLAALSILGTFFAAPAGVQIGGHTVSPSAHLRVILMLFRVWTGVSLSSIASTLPLLAAVDMVLGHVAAMVSTHDHVLFTRLLADHCAELCVVVSEGDVVARGIGASPVYL